MKQNRTRRKVLLVLEATLGGTGRHILDLAEGLLSQGLEVHLVYSPLRADIQFRDGLLALKSKWDEFKDLSLSIKRELGLADIKAYWRLLQYTRRRGSFDVIHSHSTKAGFLARLLVGTKGAAQIYTPHGLMTNDPSLTGFKRKAVSWLESQLARRARAIVMVSEAEIRCALQTGLPEDLLVRIPNGVSNTALRGRADERKSVRQVLGIPSDALVIGFIGRLCDHKNPDHLLETFAAFKRRWRGPTMPYLVIVGTGPMESGLRRLALALQLSKELIWAGAVNGNQYVCAFDLLAHTSRSEGFSYVFLEALASGVPIVTTRVGGIEELGINGLTGLVCDPWDPERFAGMLQRLLSDDELRATLARNARQLAPRFDVSVMVESISKLYDRVTCREFGGLLDSQETTNP